MAEKKRKRAAEDEQRPRKKVATRENAQSIKVTHITQSDALGPVIGMKAHIRIACLAETGFLSSDTDRSYSICAWLIAAVKCLVQAPFEDPFRCNPSPGRRRKVVNSES